MPHYYFETRDPDLLKDKIGLEIPSIEEAKIEAARCLAEMAKERVPGIIQQTMSVEVFDHRRHPILEVRLRLEVVQGDAAA